ncbi:MAG: cupin domain-containing protein [Acidobacteria bacterium]|nr:cupin domain-containing protein [Acidobacteriota bacterium]MCI0719009.1 cupin domain-containing protein [Acidobacteriota bacterium]
MSYLSSPRPTFTGPAHISYESVTRHLWGDKISGQVADWIYVSSSMIHQLVFCLPPGAAFRHSDSYRTIFAADEVLYVLSGFLVINNPETGEVHRINPGESVFFRRDTWHHGFNCGSEPVRVLEFMAPPPSQGTSGAYARTKPDLATPRSTLDQVLGRWPIALSEIEKDFTMRVLRDSDILWRLEGRVHRALVGILASTEHLTVGRIDLAAGQQTEIHSHAGDEGLYLSEGEIQLRTPENQGQSWFELKSGDGFYVPKGTPHQYYNVSSKPARVVFGVAPTYLPHEA